MDGQDSVAEKGVLHRLLQARDQSSSQSGRAPQLPLTPTLTPAKAGAVAIARAANDLFNLPMIADEVSLGGVTLAELPEVLPEAALLAVLQGPKDAVGVMAISLEAVIGLIEIQTVNQVTARPLQRRRATRADALMCAEFIDKLLEELGHELGLHEGFEGVGGFRYASNLDEPRPLQLILTDVPHRCITFQLRIGRDKLRQATIFLALPQCAISTLPLVEKHSTSTAGDPSIVATSQTEQATINPPTLAAAVQDCLVEIVGVLTRRQITLGELRKLQPGKVLTLPRADLSKTRIELSTGEVIATGKLGEAAGCHAIRIADPLAQQDTSPAMVNAVLATKPGATVPMEFAIGNELPMDLSAPDDFLNPMADDPGDDEIMPDFGMQVSSSGV